MATMKQFTAVIEKCAYTGLYVGHVPGISGAHSQAATLDELNANLKEVLEILPADGIKSGKRIRRNSSRIRTLTGVSA